MKNIKLVERCFGKSPTFLGIPKGFTRNELEFYEVDGQQIVAKKYINHDLFRREKLAYEILEKDDHIKTPIPIFWGDDFALFETLKSDKELNLALVLSDWAGVHTRYYNQIDNLPKLFTDPLRLEKRIMRIVSGTRKNRSLFCGKGDIFATILEKNMGYFLDNKEATLVHNDLIPRNFITKGSQNYYFDFEFTGIGNPAQDIVPLLLDYPNRSDEFLDRYKAVSSLDIDKDCIKLYSLLRACDIINLMDARKIPQKKKSNVKKRFLGILDQYF